MTRSPTSTSGAEQPGHECRTNDPVPNLINLLGKPVVFLAWPSGVASSGISGGFFIERDRDLARRGETGRLS
jgi:hypothetical protein